jgi:hypothetical protein
MKASYEEYAKAHAPKPIYRKDSTGVSLPRFYPEDELDNKLIHKPADKPAQESDNLFTTLVVVSDDEASTNSGEAARIPMKVLPTSSNNNDKR